MESVSLGYLFYCNITSFKSSSTSTSCCLPHTSSFFRYPGPVSRKPRKRFGPVKPKQNPEPCDCRAVLFTYSQYEERFTSYKKFQAYARLPFYIERTKNGFTGPKSFRGFRETGSRFLLNLLIFVNFLSTQNKV